MNKLFMGDCLEVLREHVEDNTADLVYVDPPFNSKRDYNLFFDSKDIRSQRVAFEDTWTLKSISESLAELHTMKTASLYNLLMVYKDVAPHAFPYLVMMALRVLELHRVLKPTGSFYLHCDPTMSHYLKTVCDIIFTQDMFRNEIIWRRSNAHNKLSKQYGPIHDVILFYTKSNTFTFRPGRRPYTKKYIEQSFPYQDERGQYQSNVLTGAGTRQGDSGKPWNGYDPTPKGRHWAIPAGLLSELKGLPPNASVLTALDALDKKKFIIHPSREDSLPRYKQYLEGCTGVLFQDVWAYQPGTSGVLYGTEDAIDEDVKWLDANEEKLGYPTQKPLGLLERIIQSSSNEGDLVLDAFCGCGTTIDAAEGLHRQWVGIDITPVAIALIKARLSERYKEHLSPLEVKGVPVDLESAEALWDADHFSFQDWWVSDLGVFNTTAGTKGADKGVDAIGLYMVGSGPKDTVQVAFQVKGGKVQSKDVDALIGAMSKHKCQLGVFLTIHPPTKPMMDAAAGEGIVNAGRLKLPKVQILTLADYFSGKRPNLPPDNITFKAAKRTSKQRQGSLV